MVLKFPNSRISWTCDEITTNTTTNPGHLKVNTEIMTISSKRGNCDEHGTEWRRTYNEHMFVIWASVHLCFFLFHLSYSSCIHKVSVYVFCYPGFPKYTMQLRRKLRRTPDTSKLTLKLWQSPPFPKQRPKTRNLQRTCNEHATELSITWNMCTFFKHTDLTLDTVNSPSCQAPIGYRLAPWNCHGSRLKLQLDAVNSPAIKHILNLAGLVRLGPWNSHGSKLLDRPASLTKAVCHWIQTNHTNIKLQWTSRCRRFMCFMHRCNVSLKWIISSKSGPSLPLVAHPLLQWQRRLHSPATWCAQP